MGLGLGLALAIGAVGSRRFVTQHQVGSRESGDYIDDVWRGAVEGSSHLGEASPAERDDDGG